MSTLKSYPYEYENVLLLPNESHRSDNEETFVEKKCCHGSVDSLKRDQELEQASDKAKEKLLLTATLSVIFMVIELTGGYMAGSLAIMSDAAHLITDSLTFVVGAIGIILGRRQPNSKLNFGYKRVEVLCALASVIGIWILTLFIFYFAVQRLLNQNDFVINTNTMLIVSILGVLVNIVMAATLHGGFCHIFHHNHSHESNNSTTQHQHDEPENINVQAASLHVLGDFIQSIGVMISAVVIKIYPQAKIVDPLLTFSFSIIVLCTTLKVFKKSIAILLEAVPDRVDYEKVLSELKSIEGVRSIHNLKIWSLSNDFHESTAHIVINDISQYERILKESSTLLSKYCHQSSIQIEIN